MRQIAIATVLGLLVIEPALRAEADAPNAALQYWIAFSLCPEERGPWALTTTNDPNVGFGVPVADALMEHVNSDDGQRALVHLHRGAQCAACAWGTDLRKDGPGLAAPQGQEARALARLALLRARWRFEHGDWQEGTDDVLATMILGRHIGRDKVWHNIHFGCMLETMCTTTLAVYLPRMPAQLRRDLRKRLESLPSATPLRYAAIHSLGAIDWAREQFARMSERERVELLESLADEEMAAKAAPLVNDQNWERELARARELSQELIEAMALPTREYDRAFQERFSVRLDGCPLAQLLGIPYDVARDEESAADCRLQFVKAAIDVLNEGEAALTKHPDPYGDGAFEYAPFEGGFELRSDLKYGMQQIKMEIGFRDARP